MPAGNTATSWGWVARLFHWVMALMIIAMLTFGLMMTAETDMGKQFQAIQQHKSMGFLVLCLVILRITWRVTQPTPRLPEHMPKWQVGASHASHLAVYILIFAMPLTGWLMVTSSPLNDPGAYPIEVKNMVFGLFSMPDPFAVGNKELSDRFRDIHHILARALIALLLLHVAAALKHALIDRDGVFSRMLRG